MVFSVCSDNQPCSVPFFCAALLGLLLQLMTAPTAAAYSLEATGSERWVIIGARDNMNEAVALAREFGQRVNDVRVVRTENGWYAICLGPIHVQSIDEARRRYAPRFILPGDAYIGKGSKLIEVVFRTSPSGSSGPTETATRPPNPEPQTHNARLVGTGFFISEKGHLLTNAHVVKGCAVVSVFHGADTPRTGRIIARDGTNDLAIIATDLTPDAVADLRVAVRLGEQVAAFGFPLSGLLSSGGNFTLGNITALTGLRDDSRMLQISAPVQPGNSGGPLLDEAGRVIGVVVGKLNAIKVAMVTDDLPQNINFAIKASVAQSFAESQGIPIHAASSTAPTIPPADLADRARAFTGRVECVP